jgi:periplasmic copper chaperone A
MKAFLFFVALLAASFSHAHDFKAKDIRIVHPFATPTVPGAKNGAAYLTLENKGKDADKLMSASTPRAQRVELHTMSMDGGVMRMREVNDVEVKAAETIKMRPGQGFHLMLMEVSAPLKDGDRFPLTLVFEKSGKVEVNVFVQTPKDSGASHQHKH